MEIKRKLFQGVGNIILFNWHFYVIAGILFILALLLYPFLPATLQLSLLYGAIILLILIISSLVVSFYIYDLSGLYTLSWLEDLNHKKVINIHAGFDETTEAIRQKFPAVDLTICDFYDPRKHTELSIKRARRFYPPPQGTKVIQTASLPFPDDAFDCIIVIFSAHEIRDEQERIRFFSELNRIIQPSGQIFVTEHLRDVNNFLAYSAGCMHFYSKKKWCSTFQKAHLTIRKEIKSTPFITTFMLEKNGATL